MFITSTEEGGKIKKPMVLTIEPSKDYFKTKNKLGLNI